MQDPVDVEPFVEDFATWSAANGTPTGDEPLLAEVAAAWFEGSLEYARLACSPHRIQALQNLVAIEWEPAELPAVALTLPTWVRWCAEWTGLSPELTARAVAASELDVASWHLAGDVGWFVGHE